MSRAYAVVQTDLRAVERVFEEVLEVDPVAVQVLALREGQVRGGLAADGLVEVLVGRPRDQVVVVREVSEQGQVLLASRFDDEPEQQRAPDFFFRDEAEGLGLFFGRVQLEWELAGEVRGGEVEAVCLADIVAFGERVAFFVLFAEVSPGREVFFGVRGFF